jgi:parallel beta-helix repeat protein
MLFLRLNHVGLGERKLLKRTVSGVMLTLLLTSMLTLALSFNIRPVKASGTIYIRADGSIDPPTAPITTLDNVTYTLTGNITSDADGIVVERDNIVLDGLGLTVQTDYHSYPYPPVHGIDLIGRSNATVRNIKITNFWCGVYLSGSSNNGISGNIIVDNVGYGIMLNGYSDHNSIFENNILSNGGLEWRGTGIWLNCSSSNTVFENNIMHNLHSITAFGSSNNNNVSRNNIVGEWWGLSFEGVVDTIVSRNNITNHHDMSFVSGPRAALSFSVCSNSVISENNITNNSAYGAELDSSSNNTVIRNSITNNTETGFSLSSSSDNNVSENSLTNNECGFQLGGSTNNNVSGNILTNNSYGLALAGSANNMFRDNILTNNRYNFGSDGSPNDIDVSNTVNGKPIYYWINKQDLFVPSGFGYIALINCTRIIVQNLNMTGNGQGIVLASTTNSTITNNTMTDNDCGIVITSSSGSIISANNVTNNTGNGIELNYGSNNTISENNILENGHYGVQVRFSCCNVISGNNIARALGCLEIILLFG